MRRILSPGRYLALFAVLSAPAAAQTTGTRLDRNRGAVGSVKLNDPKSAVRAAHDFGVCVARREGARMRMALDLPFTSPEQSAALKKTQDRFDGCLGTSADYDTLLLSDIFMIGGAAEYFVTTDLRKVDVSALAGMSDEALDKTVYRPRTSIEDLGLCIVRRNPATTRALLATRIGTEEEGAAFKMIMPDVGPCVVEGNTMKLNKASLRAVIAYALYRATSKVGAAGA